MRMHESWGMLHLSNGPTALLLTCLHEAQVLKTNPRLALVNIVCVGPKVLEEAFSGVIRSACNAL